VVLAAFGLALVAAPAVFQMFTRAPLGAEMIKDFEPFMTEQKLTTIQGYFLTMGAAEGELRTQLIPALEQQGGMTAQQVAAQLPAVREFSADWPHISNQMAPMIGTMADNIDNYAAVHALPPFWLFPWFFVLPGLLIAGLALWARRGTEAGTEALAAGELPPNATARAFLDKLIQDAAVRKGE
jgi:hypothetical protein